MESKLRNLGALWSKEGEDYLTGTLDVATVTAILKHHKETGEEKIRIVVFANSYKKTEKHPDFNILLSKPKKSFKRPEVEEEDEEVDDYSRRKDVESKKSTKPAPKKSIFDR